MLANCSEPRRAMAGFTLVELVTILLIMGILAAIAIPRMAGTDEFRAVQFRDQVVSTLRYAHKTAISHRRMVCVAFTATTVTLTIATLGGGAACNANLRIPGAPANVLNSPDPATALFDPMPAAFSFQADGRAIGAGAITVRSLPAIRVVGDTGYVIN